MKNTKKYSDLIEGIVALKEEGKGSRFIGKTLGCSKSFVNYSYNHYLANQDEGETEDIAEDSTALEGVCKSDDWNLSNLAKRLRSAQRTNNQLRKVQREAHDSEEVLANFLSGMKGACSTIGKSDELAIKEPTSGKRLTAEVLVSDIQIGKLMSNYNTEISFTRMKEHSRVVINKIKQHQNNGYHFDRIVLALLGDIIESDEKHPNSGRACDTSTAEQIKNSIEGLMLYMVEPLAKLGIPMDCICITGNHDWNGHGLNMYKPGRNQLSYPLFNAVKMISEAKGYNHVAFVIPDGSFHVDNIYGFDVLYEHGVGVSAAEASMSKRRQQRSEQLRKHITYMRMGDKHNISRFNEDTLVVNGSYFGGDKEGTEYSSICGYASDPAQLAIFHTPRTDDRLSVYDSVIVQLKHIK